MSKLYRAIIRRQITVGFSLGVALGLNPTLALAGPCSASIAQFETAMHQSVGNPYAGLTAPQSIDAQIDRQPTVASMKKAEQSLKSKFAATMARAKRLDAQNNRAGCERALSVAKRMYIL
jgi:hypothetical protein